MSGRCCIHTLEPLYLLGIHFQPHSWLDLASVGPHIWPYSLPDSLSISPDKGCIHKHCPSPFAAGPGLQALPCFPSPPVPTHDFCRDLWWFPLQEQVSHAEEALAQGSSLEEDMGWEVAVHTLPGATGM